MCLTEWKPLVIEEVTIKGEKHPFGPERASEVKLVRLFLSTDIPGCLHIVLLDPKGLDNRVINVVVRVEPYFALDSLQFSLPGTPVFVTYPTHTAYFRGRLTPAVQLQWKRVWGQA